MANKIPDVFSTHSAAKFCRVTPMTIIRWIDEGRIKAYKTPGGHRRIMRADLEDFCRRNEIPMQWEERVTTGTRRVLIIDDDPSVVHAILDALFDDEAKDTEAAFEVEHTNNAFDAGRLLNTFRPDVVFLDLQLPGVDAKAVAHTIRTDPATAAARVIGIGADGSHKPVDVDEVLSRPIAKQAVQRVTGPMPTLPFKR